METSYTHARQHFAELCDKVIDDCETIIIHRRGKPDVALIGADELSSILETLHVFGTPENTRHILDTMDSARRGEHSSLSIKEMWELVNRGVETTA